MDNRCAKNGAGRSYPVWSRISQCGPVQPPRVFLNRARGFESRRGFQFPVITPKTGSDSLMK
jgi:hypothetical protein